MMIFHQAAHSNLYGRSTIDTFVGKLISSLLIIQSFKRYSDDHRLDHHGSAHMTLKDPTVQALLIGLGLRCGMSIDEMWRRVLRKAISPSFHVRFAWGRLRSLFNGPSSTERLIFFLIYGCAIVIVFLEGWWLEFALLWLVPLFPMFQVSNVFRLCVKHTFPAADNEVRTGRAHIASLSNAIFIGEAAPVGLRGSAAVFPWAKWILRMLVIHLPVRLLVLTGDTVVHDYHHRHPRAREWAKYIFLRQQDMEDGHKGWPSYREVWGLNAGMNIVFSSLEKADPAEFDVNKIASVSDRELFEAFED
ncbi:hypothetical protein [Agrobacterium rosae]|nr:hypothetical protein [Agrobacterium rosae]